MTRQPPQSDARAQLDKFKDLARQLEADEDEERFEETVKRVSTPNSPRKSPGNDPGAR